MYRCWLPNADNWENSVSRFVFSLPQARITPQRPFPPKPKTPIRSAIDLALEFQRLLDERLVNNRAAIAERYGISRARVTQVLNLLRLPREILNLLAGPGDAKLSERKLRTIVALPSQEDQVATVGAMAVKPVQTDSWPV